MSPTIAATRALTDLVHTARSMRENVADTVPARSVYGIASIEQTLDGARTRLVEDGEHYLDAAWAFIDAGRRMLAEYRYALALHGLGVGNGRP